MAGRKRAGPNEFSLFAAMPRRERSRDSDTRKSPGQSDVPRRNRSTCRLDRRIPTSPGGLHTCPRRNVPACHSFACAQRFQASSSVFLILLVRFLSGSLLTGSCRTFFLTQVSLHRPFLLLETPRSMTGP